MRLIDGDTLWEKLDDEPWYDNADRDEIALPIVAAAPTVDAVEVVRCRDCKYGTSVWSGSVLCGHPEYDLLEGVLAYEADHFCAYGRKKETTQSLRP